MEISELEERILNEILDLEFENKTRLYKGGQKAKVREEIKKIIKRFSEEHHLAEGNYDN